MNRPELSVVMSVFNSAETLPTTLDSVLTQEDVDLELIAVDDGSTDRSGQILLDYVARDSRVTVLRQENNGLTLSLIKGCAVAQGVFIARQDAGGDISLPGRFARQLAFLRSEPTAVMIACGTRIVDPKGELLYEICQKGDQLNRVLRAASQECLGGPSHHGAVVFRKSAYERVGGYRSAFRVAQDLDLWTRLAEVGDCIAMPDVLYEARLTYGSISHLNQQQQKHATAAIVRCIQARREGRDEAQLLGDIKNIQGPRGWLFKRLRDAGLNYFIGSVLRTREPQRAHEYFMRALFCWPLYPRAWLGLLRTTKPARQCSAREDART